MHVFYPAGDAVFKHLWHCWSRNSDNNKVRRLGERPYIRTGLETLNLGILWVDRIKLTIKPEFLQPLQKARSAPR